MKTEKINQYYLCCNCRNIASATKRNNENGERNELYYTSHLTNRKHNAIEEVNKLSYFDPETKDRLRTFNYQITYLQEKIINLLKIVCEYEGNKHKLKEIEKRGLETSLSIKENQIGRYFTKLDYDVLFIKQLIERENFYGARQTQKYLIKSLESMLLFFKTWYEIDLLNSPFKENFKNLLINIQTSINEEEINLLIKETARIDDDIYDLKSMIDYFKAESMKIDIMKEIPLGFDVLEREKIKLETADFEAEVVEVKEFAEDAVKEIKKDLRVSYLNKHYKWNYINHPANFLLDIRMYLEYLNLFEKAESQLLEEAVFHSEENKKTHFNIFKDNSFEIFSQYHSEKNLTESCRTDLRLIFELMKIDDLLVETVELKHYIQWLNITYNYSITELKKVNLDTRPNLQRKNDYKRIKRQP